MFELSQQDIDAYKDSGFIALHRKLLEWEWYSDLNCTRVFIHLLLKANHQDKTWRGIAIKRGQHLTSLEILAKDTSLSVMQIRNTLTKLKSTQEIIIAPSTKYSLITINKYSQYQDRKKKSNKVITQHEQSDNKVITTNNNVNKENNVIKEYLDAYKEIIGGRTLSLTDSRKKAIEKFSTKVSLPEFKEGLHKVKNSQFLTDSTWCKIDWICKEANFIKIMEDNYINKPSGSNKQQPPFSNFSEERDIAANPDILNNLYGAKHGTK